MRRRPSGPWYTAYIEAMTASSTWAVQMFDVAFSRRMCCSRVCSASRNAVLPLASRDTPMIRPGIWRRNSSLQDMNAACGPPKPIGTPNRCALPIAMSAPSSPGGVSSVSASRSVAITTAPAAAWIRATSAL